MVNSLRRVSFEIKRPSIQKWRPLFYRSAPILFIHHQVQFLETIFFVTRLFSQEQSLTISVQQRCPPKRWATPKWSHDETTPLSPCSVARWSKRSCGLNGSPKNPGHAVRLQEPIVIDGILSELSGITNLHSQILSKATRTRDARNAANGSTGCLR